MFNQQQLKQARAVVNAQVFGTKEFEAAMDVVRALVEKMQADRPAEEFCSVDSGFHRTRQLNGRVF